MCPATGELRPPPASTMRDLPHTSACNESAQPCASRANWERVSMNAPTQSQKAQDRKSTRLNSSHGYISYAVFCLKKKKKKNRIDKQHDNSKTKCSPRNRSNVTKLRCTYRYDTDPIQTASAVYEINSSH